MKYLEMTEHEAKLVQRALTQYEFRNQGTSTGDLANDLAMRLEEDG